MASAQSLEQFHVGEKASHTARTADDLAAEARLGAGLARALIEHINRMRAAGYDNEILVDGEIWSVKLKRDAKAS